MICWLCIDKIKKHDKIKKIGLYKFHKSCYKDYMKSELEIKESTIKEKTEKKKIIITERFLFNLHYLMPFIGLVCYGLLNLDAFFCKKINNDIVCIVFLPIAVLLAFILVVAIVASLFIPMTLDESGDGKRLWNKIKDFVNIEFVYKENK